MKAILHGLVFILLCALHAGGQSKALKSAEPMVDVAVTCPSIMIELRYATARNTTGRALYAPGARCLVRQSVAARLKVAQAWLQTHGVGLKIWDAYRPASVQQALWQIVHNPRFVANPLLGASMHTRGVAVDATLVDRFGRELLMPTDFDAFSEAARRVYLGGDQSVGRNLALLQAAMARAGFLGMEEEWWHFVAKDHFLFDAIPDDSLVDSVTMTLKP